jgi:hypothetical protein
MGKYLSKFKEFNLTPNQSVGELAWFDGKRADVAGKLLRIFFNSFSKDHLEHAVSCVANWTEDQCHEVWINGDRRQRGGCERKIDSSDVNPRGRPRSLSHFKRIDEHCRHDVHATRVVPAHGSTIV